MKNIAGFLLIFLIAGCASRVIQPTVAALPERHSYGPFLLPGDPSMNSVEICYGTDVEEPTRVFFSMVGEPDWARSDTNVTRDHTMRFEGLEESTEYLFSIRDERSVKMKTVPYGDQFRFCFAVAEVGQSIELKETPHFLLLLSDRTEMGRSEFLACVEEYRKISQSTVIVPVFQQPFGNPRTPLFQNGVGFIRYRNAMVVMVTGEVPLDRVSRYLSDSPDDENFIVMSGVRSTYAESARYRFHECVRSIYSSSDQPQETAGTAQWVIVEKKTHLADRR